MPASCFNLGGIRKIVAGSARPGLNFRRDSFFKAGIPPKRRVGKALLMFKQIILSDMH